MNPFFAMTVLATPSRVIPLKPITPRFKEATMSTNMSELASAPREKVIESAFTAFQWRPANNNWVIRILPPHAESRLKKWYQHFRVYDVLPQAPGVVPQLVMPLSLGYAEISDPFLDLQEFIKKHFPHLEWKSSDGANGRGLQLWARDKAVCWIYIVKAATDVIGRNCPVRLWYDSFYSGNQFRQPGVLKQAQNLCEMPAASFDGTPAKGLKYGDISHPESGRLLSIATGYDSLEGFKARNIQVDERPTPLDPLTRIFAAHPDFPKVHVPIEDVVRVPSTEELTQALDDYIAYKFTHGQVGPEVLAAYRECFGRNIRSKLLPELPKAVAVTGKPSPVASAPAPKPNQARKVPRSSMVDDIDQPKTPTPAAVSGVPSTNLSPTGVLTPSATSAPAETKKALTLPPLPNKNTATKDEIITYLKVFRSAKTAITPDVTELTVGGLFTRFSNQLTPEDLDLVDALSA